MAKFDSINLLPGHVAVNYCSAPICNPCPDL